MDPGVQCHKMKANTTSLMPNLTLMQCDVHMNGQVQMHENVDDQDDYNSSQNNSILHYMLCNDNKQ